MIIIDILLGCLAMLVALPGAVFFFECVLSLFPTSKKARGAGPPLPPLAVIVPAHDEELGISATLKGIRSELGDEDRLIVVADNCTDRTADIAREHGATVLERNDPDRRGKGYAISFAVDYLRASPPEIVVIIDADCRIGEASIRTLGEQVVATGDPAQAEYLMRTETPSFRSRISAFAFLVRNRVRPRGLHWLGLPCHLTGTGMAFPFRLLSEAPSGDDHLVEDLVLGLYLAERGHPPRLCPGARVDSDLPMRDAAALAQRRRWEHGQLATLFSRGPRLFWRGIRSRSGELVALAVDLMVPPLALLVGFELVAVGLTGLGWVFGGSPVPLLMATSGLALLGSGVGIAWLGHGTRTLPPAYFLAAPLYVLWKLPLYLAFARRRRQATWERTERPVGEP